MCTAATNAFVVMKYVYDDYNTWITKKNMENKKYVRSKICKFVFTWIEPYVISTSVEEHKFS